MAEPTSAFTFEDLIIRIAEIGGIADYKASPNIALIPTDDFNFDKCKRIANNAILRFVGDSPINGWRWMNRMMSVTFDADGAGDDNIATDAARYLLPQDFGGVAGDISYAADSNKGVRIDWTDEGTIRARREITVQTGTPTLAAVRPYTNSSDPRRFELIVDPQPDGVYTIKFPYRVYFDKLQMEHGTATGGSPTTLEDSSRIEADDYFNDWVLKIIYGTGRGETATITDYEKFAGTFTFSALSGGSTPDTTSIYIVEPANNLHPAGYRFDDVIYHACMAQAELEFEDVDAGWTQLYYTIKLPAAHRIDAQLAPRKVGAKTKKPVRLWNDVTYS